MEIWKPVVGFDSYEVSNRGHVRSFKRKTPQILKLKRDGRGYTRVGLYAGDKQKWCLVHRLVAQTFIPNLFNKPQINHIDGDKTNNCVENLEWCTAGENRCHAYATGLQAKIQGENRHDSKLTNEQITWIRSVYKPRDHEFGARALASKFSVSESAINSVVRGRSYKTATGQIHQKACVPANIRDEIRRIYVKGDPQFGARPLARRYGVSKTTIQYIVKTEPVPT